MWETPVHRKFRVGGGIPASGPAFSCLMFFLQIKIFPNLSRAWSWGIQTLSVPQGRARNKKFLPGDLCETPSKWGRSLVMSPATSPGNSSGVQEGSVVHERVSLSQEMFL